jgi:hypothetical protein
MKCRGDFTERKIFFKNQTFTYTMAWEVIALLKMFYSCLETNLPEKVLN